MESKIPTQFDTEILVALYLVSAKTTRVSSSELSKFNTFLANKFSQLDASLPKSERLNSMFLLSDFHLKQFGDSKIFNVTKEKENGERQISCAINEPIEKTIKLLQDNVLAKGFAQNPRFMQAATEFAQQYCAAKNPTQSEKKEKPLSKKEEEERWWRIFG